MRAEQSIPLFDCCYCNKCNKKVKHGMYDTLGDRGCFEGQVQLECWI